MEASEKKSYAVCLLDDDRFLIDMYALKFRALGHTVSPTSRGEDLIALLREHPEQDVILLDVVMPGMTGFEVLEAIRKENLAPNAAVIMLTNQGADTDLERARELHADGYIIKASSIPSEVVARTTEIIEHKRSASV